MNNLVLKAFVTRNSGFNFLFSSNLNGPYVNGTKLEGKNRGVGITWGSYDDIQYSYKFAQMMVRSKKKAES